MTRGGEIGQTNGVSLRRTLGLVCAISTFYVAAPFSASPALADARVRVDAAAKKLVHAGGTVDIPLAVIPTDKVVVDDVPLGGGRFITHVRVSAGEPNAWEALVAGGTTVVWSGLTGFTRGQDGERTGDMVQVLTRSGMLKDVLVGEVAQDRVICGQTMTALSPKVLDARTMELRGATVQRLPLAQREKATRIVAVARRGPAEAPLGRMLVATAASSGTAKSLTDGDAETLWSEDRPGAGQGEFVTMETPPEVPITRLSLTIAPKEPDANGAAPQTLFLVARERTYAITLPEDAWTHPGEAYDIPLPEPVSTACLSLVLHSAYVRGKSPDVGVAELIAYSAFDAPGATLETVARALSGGGARAEAAAAVLKRATGSLAAVRAVFPELDAPGRALAIDVASAAACADSGPLLCDALGDDDREVARKAQGKLERCARTAAPALADAVRKGSPRVRVRAATLLAHVAPREALTPLADALDSGDVGDGETRAAVRGALGHAAQGAEKDALGQLLARPGSPGAKLEMLRALSGRLGDVRAEADQRVAELLVPGADMRTRYLLTGPLADLARAGDSAAAARLGSLLATDHHVAVRARAAELAGGIPAVDASLVTAIDDPAPRVREAALRAVASSHLRAAEARAIARLWGDGWTFVRMAAASALATLGPSPAADHALEVAFHDASPRVRAASVEALAARGVRTSAAAIGARAFDEKEDVTVRLAAVRALGKTCATDTADGLYRLAAAGASQVADDDARSLAIAAVDALGHLGPKDLAPRLAKVRAADANDAVKRAVDHALKSTEVCK